MYFIFCVLMFLDQFGSEKYDKFARRLEWALGLLVSDSVSVYFSYIAVCVATTGQKIWFSAVLPENYLVPNVIIPLAILEATWLIFVFWTMILNLIIYTLVYLGTLNISFQHLV